MPDASLPAGSAPEVLILQHVCPEPPGRIADVLDAKNLGHRVVQVFRDEPVPETLGAARGLVVMGGPMGIGDLDARPHLRQELALIEAALAAEVPVLGVCLGSQLLAHVLGADVRPGPGKEIGWHDITLTDAASRDSLWQGIDSPRTVFHWHGDVFDVPDGAVTLARSARTDCQAFRYGDHAYGLLFHLEVTPAIVDGMTEAFAGALDAAGLDGAALRQAARTHDAALRDLAQTVFGRWADRVAATAPR
jgi:GMP synthase (glutamine-hydrolysing)